MNTDWYTYATGKTHTKVITLYIIEVKKVEINHLLIISNAYLNMSIIFAPGNTQ